MFNDCCVSPTSNFLSVFFADGSEDKGNRLNLDPDDDDRRNDGLTPDDPQNSVSTHPCLHTLSCVFFVGTHHLEMGQMIVL